MAVTVVAIDSAVVGNRRMVNATLNVTADSDTWVVPGIKKIFAAETTPATAIVNGATTSGATITFRTAGASPMQVMVVGI